MTMLERMLDNKLQVNWTTILEGWDGPGKYLRQLSIKDVSSYASQLIEANPEQPIEVLELAGATDDESDSVDRLIRRLAAQETVDAQVEIRKWRLLLLKEVMNELESDPLYGLLKLTEFWDKFDYPKDGPHVIQGTDSDQSPEDYYTDANFQFVIQRHRRWIEREQDYLMRVN